MYANHTLPKTNSEFSPENGWLEDAFPFRKAYFTGPCWFQGGYHPNFHVSCSTPTTFHCLHLMMCPNIVPLSSICIVFWYSGRVHINKQTSDFGFSLPPTSVTTTHRFQMVFGSTVSHHQTSTKHNPGTVDQGPSWPLRSFFWSRPAGRWSNGRWSPALTSTVDYSSNLRRPGHSSDMQKSIKISSNASKGAGKLETIASKKGILPWFINYSTTYQLPSIFITWLVPQNPSIHLFFFGALSSNSRLS